jgi:protein N-terminal asparagine amidohydrolase
MNKIISKNKQLVKSILSNEIIKKNNFQFKNQKEIHLENQKFLHVFQREFATILPDQFDYIGSSEATTCNILFIRSKKTGKISCAHFDGSQDQVGKKNCSLKKMISTFDQNELNDVLELHFVGGYFDGSENSNEITESILIEFEKYSVLTEIQTFFVSMENSMMKGDILHPIYKSASMETSSGKLYPTIFHHYGPQMEVRGVRGFTGEPHLENIFDYKSNTLILGPYYYGNIDRPDLYLQLKDEILLKYLSTSPEVESENFVPHLRKTLKFLVDHPDCDEFFKQKPICYQFENGEWKNVEMNKI